MEKKISDLMRTAQKDPSLYPNIDIQEIIESVNKERYNYINEMSAYDIQQEVYSALKDNNVDKISEYAEKLLSYRYIDSLNELQSGKFIRWIRKTDKTLTNGNIFVNIEFTKDRTLLLLKSPTNRFIRIKWDECIVFQILTPEEQLILTTNQYIQDDER